MRWDEIGFCGRLRACGGGWRGRRARQGWQTFTDSLFISPSFSYAAVTLPVISSAIFVIEVKKTVDAEDKSSDAGEQLERFERGPEGGPPSGSEKARSICAESCKQRESLKD